MTMQTDTRFVAGELVTWKRPPPSKNGSVTHHAAIVARRTPERVTIRVAIPCNYVNEGRSFKVETRSVLPRMLDRGVSDAVPDAGQALTALDIYRSCRTIGNERSC